MFRVQGSCEGVCKEGPSRDHIRLLHKDSGGPYYKHFKQSCHNIGMYTYTHRYTYIYVYMYIYRV